MGKTTIRDVAREAGVSISLVSLVMNAKRDAEGNLECNVNRETARRILEIGTYSGYSALCLAEGLGPEGRLYSFEINDEQEDFTRPWIEQSAYASQIEFIIGNVA